ncbi:MAG: YdiU family protein [Alphaproteobacteria bacterium]
MNWQFDNSFARLPDSLFSHVAPTPVREPALVIFNHALADRLGLRIDGLDESELTAILAGNAVPAGATPIAQAYAGHQFGNFTMLGDGRAVVLGEHVAPDGRRCDLQLKGAGQTPYSRRGDGRAALGPMLREYIVSEGMHALGIPTTRSLAVVATGEPVYREEVLPGAVLARVAASHLRVGTFQYAAARQDIASLTSLVGYAIDRHYPHLREAGNPALALLGAVVERQAALLVEWMRVGFIHGVMNTDNMTVSGETIDYGPCAFMEAYDPATTFSSIDWQRRYAYGNQPSIAVWNLARFAEALLPLIDAEPEKAVEGATERVLRFNDLFRAGWNAMMRRKLGLFGEQPDDMTLIEDLLAWMQAREADYTATFRAFADGAAPAAADDAFVEWSVRWQARLAAQPESKQAAQLLMQAANPVYIPRNHRVEAALRAAGDGDLQPLHTLLDVLSKPYERRAGFEAFEAPAPAGERVLQTFCGT